MAPRIICLLPARNALTYLPGFFDSARRFAHAIVALDDGSTDETFEYLRAEPLVSILLRNSPRTSYKGWNDADNRQRLLHAAHSLDPDWIISLDADERIDQFDSSALLTLVETVARRDHVYCFQIHRMIRDEGWFDLRGPFVCRLFAFEKSHLFPSRRFHFPLAPTSIPPERWLYTTIRVQHMGSSNKAGRRDRFQKYWQCDPDCNYQSSYEHLLARPRDVQRWNSRPPDLPLVLGRHIDLFDQQAARWW